MTKQHFAQARAFWCTIYNTTYNSFLDALKGVDGGFTDADRKAAHEVSADAADAAVEKFNTCWKDESNEVEGED